MFLSSVPRTNNPACRDISAVQKSVGQTNAGLTPTVDHLQVEYAHKVYAVSGQSIDVGVLCEPAVVKTLNHAFVDRCNLTVSKNTWQPDWPIVYLNIISYPIVLSTPHETRLLSEALPCMREAIAHLNLAHRQNQDSSGVTELWCAGLVATILGLSLCCVVDLVARRHRRVAMANREVVRRRVEGRRYQAIIATPEAGHLARHQPSLERAFSAPQLPLYSPTQGRSPAEPPAYTATDAALNQPFDVTC